MHYIFSTEEASSHFIRIDVQVKEVKGNELLLQLPAWRPGRYELGNFARNIRKFEAATDTGAALPWKKLSKDKWCIQTLGAKAINISYYYYAAEINAGSSYIDEQQLYVNPVNCCMYVPERMEEIHTIELKVPADYKLAGAVKLTAPWLIEAKNFDTLADTPFVASGNIQTLSYTAGGISFTIHFIGECHPQQEKVIKDFSRFSQEVIAFYPESPITKYQFIVQVLPFPFYHGVEHLESTVLALGPGHELMNGDLYNELLGVACHELFHTWNIKSIRPVEMLPYDFTKENYARTGFVYEGITTYYGDKLLLTSGVYSEAIYFETLEQRLNKHFHNYGRFNLSLADASFDTWIDGYVPGVPYRKVSIYDEGNLIAFLLDIAILKSTHHQKSLRDLMCVLWTEFYKKGKGYTENDIQSIVHHLSGKSFDDFFNRYVYGLEEYEIALEEAFDYLGLKLEKYLSSNKYDHFMGLKTTEQGGLRKIVNLAPGSPAWHAGLAINDEIIAVNKRMIKGDYNALLNYFFYQQQSLELTVVSQSVLKSVEITIALGKEYFHLYKIRKTTAVSAAQQQNKGAWLKQYAQ